jgi:DNA processing protein
MEWTEEWLCRIALRLVPGIGDKLYKVLIANCGSAQAVFKEHGTALHRIPGIGASSVANILKGRPFERAEQELAFMEKNGVSAWFYLDDGYPSRLKWCEDGPVILYHKGNFQRNRQPMLAMVGTRNATAYGLRFCEEFIEDLIPYSPVIVSGLAYGIDIKCHRAAMDNQLSTLAILGHGLDRVYPALHKADAERMIVEGGLITEFMSDTKPDRENFPRRNRIVAGMCDAVLVVEAARKGGALLTAELANSYNREVFALPGRMGDTFSEGCNYLIRTNKASLISSVKDLEYLLNWEKQKEVKSVQQELNFDLSEEETALMKFLGEKAASVEIASLCQAIDQPVNHILQLLMGLELKGLVRALPGKTYQLTRGG